MGASKLGAEPRRYARTGFFTRPHLADYIATGEESRGRAADLFTAYDAARVAVTVDREFSLAEAAEAHRGLEWRNTKGKLLLRV